MDPSRITEQQSNRLKMRAVERFPMPMGGIHGIAHWSRVRENGLLLAKLIPDVDRSVVEAFAWLHDCCRESDGHDLEHGKRAAEFARQLAEEPTILSFLEAEQLKDLCTACEFHADGQTTDHPTIGACWDADRLDLFRVGIRPNSELLNTEIARHPPVIHWAVERSRGLEMPVPEGIRTNPVVPSNKPC